MTLLNPICKLILIDLHSFLEHILFSLRNLAHLYRFLIELPQIFGRKIGSPQRV